MSKFSYFLSFSIFILICSLLIFPNYKLYCKNCAQTCALFTGKNLGNCIKQCYCPNIKPTISKHVDDYSIFLDDINEQQNCKNGYSNTPHISKKTKLSKTNIVLFVLDDLDEMISPYFDVMKFSKELFQINGTHYKNAYTSTSYCCPARCQIFTGLYPHNNGVLGMHGKYGSIEAFRKPHHLNGTRMKENDKCINNENRAINLLLQKYGNYHTSIVGKYLNGIEHESTKHIDYVPVGWDDFHIGSDPYMYGGYRYTLTNWSSDDNIVNYKWYSVNAEDYVTDVIADRSEYIIDKHMKHSTDLDHKPIFMYIAPTAPHLPIPCAERHMDKQKYWASQYDNYVSNRPNYNFTSKNEPTWFFANDRRNGLNNEGISWNKIEWEKRMCSLYAVDEMIERVYNKLKFYNQHENTVFGFVSDNGYNLGAHGIFNKLAHFEESIKIPMYLSGPNIKKNHVETKLSALIDLAPTFLDIAGLDLPSYINGESLLNNESRQIFLFQYKNNIDYVKEDYLDFTPELEFIRNIVPKWMLFDFHPYAGIKTKQYVYVQHNIKNSHKEYELYDLIEDPHQMNNLYYNDSYLLIKMSLELKFEKMKNCVGKDCFI